VHPIHVAAQGVDLAIVRHVAERLSEIPRREGVRAVTLVDQGQGGNKPLVRQVGIKTFDLLGQHEPLVDDHARRKARQVEVFRLLELALADLALDTLANDVELPFQSLARRLGAPGDEDLSDYRLDVARRLADQAIIDRHVAPTEDTLSLLGNDFFQSIGTEVPLAIIARQKDDTNAVIASGRKLGADFARLGGKEVVRNLREDAGTVAGERIATAGTAMRQVHQDLQPTPHDLMRAFAVDIHHEADAARVVLVRRIVKTMGLRESLIPL